MPHFVNPYSFVPLPDTVRRMPPAGHDHLGVGRFSGEIRFRLEAATPLSTEQAGGDQRPAPDLIPGSSLHGAIRSMHETLAGGCLRVFDPTFSPSYREPADPYVVAGWRLARVETDDRGLLFRLCDDGTAHGGQTGAAWLPVGLAPQGATDGDAFHVRVGVAVDSNGRRVLEQATLTPPVPGSDVWYLKVVDKQIGMAHGHPIQPKFALGRRTSTVLRATDAAVRAYEAAAAGADDVRGGETTPTPARRGLGPGAQQLHVNRRRTAPTLAEGHLVWVTLDHDTVVGVKQSLIWRKVPDTQPAGERVPPDLLSCGRHTGPEDGLASLCPSCRLFGTAEDAPATAEGARQARQRSYRGHVRVMDLHPLGDARAVRETLAPLGGPRPGSGQFYLARPGDLRPTQPAAREWGSQKDRPTPRQLRGRKMYWRTAVSNGRERKRDHHADAVVTHRWVWPAGTRFEGRVVFENLDQVELGSLLAALRPGTLLDPEHADAHVLPVGGAKPFGFGSTRISEVTLRTWGADRYRGAAATVASAGEAVASFRAAVEDAANAAWGNPDLPATVWPAAAALTRLGHLGDDDELVWYPPGADWARKEAQEFDEGYEFWKRSAGQGHRHRDGQVVGDPMLPLPPATDASQRLVITQRPGGRR